MWISENKESTVSLNLKTANDLCLTSCLRFFASRHHDPLRTRLFFLYIFIQIFEKSIFLQFVWVNLLVLKVTTHKNFKTYSFWPHNFFLRTIKYDIHNLKLIPLSKSVSVCVVNFFFFSCVMRGCYTDLLSEDSIEKNTI